MRRPCHVQSRGGSSARSRQPAAAEVLASALWLVEEGKARPLPWWPPFADGAGLAEQRISRAEAEDIGTRTVEDERHRA